MTKDEDWQWKEIKTGFTVTMDDIPSYRHRKAWFWQLKLLTTGKDAWERIGGFWPLYTLRRPETIMDLMWEYQDKHGLKALLDSEAKLYSDGTLGGINQDSNSWWKGQA